LPPRPAGSEDNGRARGQLLAGLLAQYAPQPTVLPFVVQLGLVAAAGLGLLAVPETVSDRSALSLRFRGLGIPQVLGEDHPSTLKSASNLAANLRALGETVSP
jgi:hypothetical protein